MSVPLRMAARYRALLEVNTAAITQSVPEGVFRGMCDAVKRVIPYDRAGLTLYEPGEDAFELVARDGSFPDSFFRIGVMLDRKESHDGWALEHQRSIIRRDLETERQFPIEEHTLAEGLRSYCAVPLIVRGDSIGVVTRLSFRKNQYSEKHARFLQEVSNQIVLAIGTFMPHCPIHSRTRLICPKCLASSGGHATTTKYKEKLSGWGKKGGRGRKNPAGGLTNVTLG
jgi:formate hydrogenlyase transcriptional activator